jgi:hypothetical protein
MSSGWPSPDSRQAWLTQGLGQAMLELADPGGQAACAFVGGQQVGLQ